MFDFKCVYCKNFNPKDGCAKNLEEENCTTFEKVELPIKKEDEPSCEMCIWHTQGSCDFDLDNPKTCRCFKSIREDF